MAGALLAAAQLEAQECRAPRPSRDRAERARAEAERTWREALQAEVADSVRGAGLGEPFGLVIVEIRDRGTGKAEAQTFTPPIQGEFIRALLRRRAEHVATWPGRDGAFHLRLDPGPPAAPDAVECRPRLLNPQQARRDMMELMQRESRFFHSGRSRERIHVRLLVDRTGEVMLATLSRRGMEPLVDRAILNFMRRQEYAPATLGGLPIDVWVEIPLYLGTR